jgi:NAD(P)-dependent dehydrogenase (short-subunit alcohol dehydrogenase family)
MTTIQDDRFENKRIVITGAGGFLGREGCLFFARRGAQIAALDKSATALQETYDEVHKQTGSKIALVECDVTDPASVEGAIAQVKSQLGGIDSLWNNAGYQGQIKPTLEYDPADFAAVMNINVTGMFIVLQAVGKVMAKQETGGTIVNTASVAGIGCTPAMVAYASSKAAVLAMTVSSAKVRENDYILLWFTWSLKILCRLYLFTLTHV